MGLCAIHDAAAHLRLNDESDGFDQVPDQAEPIWVGESLPSLQPGSPPVPMDDGPTARSPSQGKFGRRGIDGAVAGRRSSGPVPQAG